MTTKGDMDYLPVSYGGTEIGQRSHNEDSLHRNDRRRVWVVADGMGGYSRGDYASQTIVNHLSAVRGVDWATPRSLALDVFDRISDANAELLAESRSLGGVSIGTTVTCLVSIGHLALAVWCGDSRVYRLSPGKRLERVTRDHSVVQEMVDAGKLDECDAESHPMAHVLTRGVGISEDLEPASKPLELSHGDRFVLCSDGLTRMVSDAEIEDVLTRFVTPRAATDQLLAMALERDAQDNVTVLTVDFRLGCGLSSSSI